MATFNGPLGSLKGWRNTDPDTTVEWTDGPVRFGSDIPDFVRKRLKKGDGLGVHVYEDGSLRWYINGIEVEET